MFQGCSLLERIGEGGIGDVFRAEWEGREVALKILRDPERASMRRRFIREGRLLQRLSHPGLVRCLSVIEGDQPALVLELLRGETLDQRVARTPLGGDEGVLLASALLRVLGFLHEHGIIHRDVKSSNIFLADDHRVVLMDLGLAVDPTDPLTTTLGDVLGTYAYMAPEQIAGAETDHRCDLYSLGITLYEAISTQRPFHARGAAQYLQVHRAGGAPPLVEVAPSVPVRLAMLVDRLMARDPAARPGSAAIALALLTGHTGIKRGLEPPRVVGREAVVGAVQALIEVGGVLRIAGEVGSGTGAMARLARDAARAEGVEQITVRCRPRTRSSEVVAVLARELSAIVEEVPPELEAVQSAIAGLAAEGGHILLVAEDIDLCLPEVPTLFAALAGTPGLGLLVIGTALPEEPAGRDIVLRPLTLPEVRKLVAGMLGSPVVPLGLDTALHQLSGGLPALVVTSVREQTERGAIWCEGNTPEGLPRWTWDPSVRLRPGADMGRMFDRALRSLPDGARSLLQALALAGGSVPLDLALQAAGLDGSGADLGPLVRAGLARVEIESGEEWVNLRRAVMEPLVIHGIALPERRRIHFALAEATRARSMGEWEQRFLVLHAALGASEPAHTERLVELGDHLVGAGRALAALEALDHAALLPLGNPRTHALLALARADALRATGRLAEAKDALSAGRAVAEEIGDDALVGRAILSQAETLILAGTALGESILEEIERRAGPMPDPRSMVVMADTSRLAGRIGEAQRLYEMAMEHSPPPALDRVAGHAKLGVAICQSLRGELDQSADTFSHLVRELRYRDRNEAVGEALCRLAVVQRMQGLVGRAVESVRVAEELATKRSTPHRVALVMVTRASIYCAAGDVDAAAEMMRAHADCAEQRCPYPLRAFYFEVLAELRLAMADSPSTLSAHLSGAEAAAGAGDATRQAFHAGMVALLTADADAVAATVERLSETGVHRLQARLLAAGAIIGRDSDVLQVAEMEARAAGDQLLLLDILYATRGPGSRSEAKRIATRVVEGLFGPLRQRFIDRAGVRWALGEPDGATRDTRA